jgi:hypothetical protein
VPTGTSACGSRASKTAPCPSPVAVARLTSPPSCRAACRASDKPSPRPARRGRLYAKAVHDSIGMFNGDGLMKADGAKNVLEVLSQFSPNVKGKKDQVDLSKTYTTQFTAKVAG